MNDPVYTRRTFLRQGAYLSLAYLAGCRGRSKEGKDLQRIHLINRSALITPIHEFPVLRLALIQDQTGLYAIKTLCSHQVCALQLNRDHFDCPCHGSQFSLAGKVLRGPAEKGLMRVKLEIGEGGEIYVYPNIEVF